MSSISISERPSRTNSFSDSFEISDLSFAPTPPPHKHTRQRSSISSTGSQLASASHDFSGSVIWNKSSSLPHLFDLGQSSRTSTPSEFSSSHASGIPLEPTSFESSCHSWSTASSSFQTGSSATLNDSAVSQKPTHLTILNSSTMDFQRPLPETPQTLDLPVNTAMQTSTTLPPIPGYGPIRLTVTMDLPPPPHHYQQSPYTSMRVDTPLSEIPPAINSDPSLDAALDSFTASELRQLLRLVVQKDPSFVSDITSAHVHKASHTTSKTTNFVHYSNSVWHTLNAKQHLDPNKARQHAEKAVHSVASDIAAVATQTSRESSLITKRNALETLRKIGRSVCLATGFVGDRVKEVLGLDRIFVDAIVKVAASFTEDDRRTLWAGGIGTEVVKRLEQLDELRSCYRIFNGFDMVLKLLKREDELNGSVYC